MHALVNEGREAGSSLAHSHSQLVWLPEAPPNHGRPKAETFLEEDGVAASCPWASRLPYETVIAPVESGGPAFRARSCRPRSSCSAASSDGCTQWKGPVPLNAWLEHDATDWRLVLLPRLTVLAGLELGAGIFVNTLPPEEAAARLKAEGPQLARPFEGVSR